MIRGTCPICARSFEIAAIGDLPSFPFCTDRCRLIDLGRWIDGRYALPVASAAQEDEERPAEEADDLEE
jgi:uncharacterized protein